MALAKTMTMLIKTCGLKAADMVSHSTQNGAHQIGFIFFEKSPRHVSPEQAAAAASPARGFADIVAVTVNADDAYLDEINDVLKPDMMQLHGSETPERVAYVKARYNLPVMKAFSIRDAHDLDKVQAYIGVADRMLFDAKAPKGSELPGGNGVSFDWSLLESLDQSVEYMLSGGLNAQNVCEAMTNTHAIGMDVSSGIEIKPGVKDKELMDGFFNAIKSCS